MSQCRQMGKAFKGNGTKIAMVIEMVNGVAQRKRARRDQSGKARRR